MRLLLTAIVAALNALLALSGLYTHGPRLVGQPSVQSAMAFMVAVLPFAATALFAFGTRTKPVWIIAASLNLLAVLGIVGLVIFMKATQSGTEMSALIATLSLPGLIAAANLAYLLWRVPQTVSGATQ